MEWWSGGVKGLNGNDNDRGRPLLLDPTVPVFHYSNTPTRYYDNTPVLRRHQNLTQDSRFSLF